MYSRLEKNAEIIFKSAKSGAHQDWVSATTFDELITKIDSWRDVVFKWMDELTVEFTSFIVSTNEQRLVHLCGAAARHWTPTRKYSFEFYYLLIPRPRTQVVG
ncbi:hypothetical protein C8F04DRAFT_1177505 [Mycena alexandri]|uniref:Uncharacterized protein n=1 Tax=Mycena alexandri TaxID=1745969 RepID=A0AAD6T9F7_9AGAR|nr:hypothetical protein C8F04DRAFT_1177505 [Mycena alexandri]